MVRQILYIHSLWLFSLAPVLRVFLEFCIGDLQPVFSYGKLLFIHRKITENKLISWSTLLPCRQPLVSHVLHWGNRFSLTFKSSRFNESCLISTVLHPWLISCRTLRLCLDWWVVVEWNGIGWHIIKFHCLDWWDVNGMEWNTMEPITFYTIQSFNFSFPQFRGYPIEWNLCLEILLFYPHFIGLFLCSIKIFHTFFSLFLPTAHLTFFFSVLSLFFFSCLLVSKGFFCTRYLISTWFTLILFLPYHQTIICFV